MIKYLSKNIFRKEDLELMKRLIRKILNSKKEEQQRSRKIESSLRHFQKYSKKKNELNELGVEFEALHQEYQVALLSSLSDEKEKKIKEIATLDNSNFLQELFTEPRFKITKVDDTANVQEQEENRKKRAECLYELFMLFIQPRFAKEEYSLQVLN